MNLPDETETVFAELQESAYQVARNVGISLSEFKLEESMQADCIDTHIMSLTARGKTVEAKITRKELDSFLETPDMNIIVLKLRSACDRLHLKLMNS